MKQPTPYIPHAGTPEQRDPEGRRRDLARWAGADGDEGVFPGTGMMAHISDHGFGLTA